jgi:hypothetical protein
LVNQNDPAHRGYVDLADAEVNSENNWDVIDERLDDELIRNQRKQFFANRDAKKNRKEARREANEKYRAGKEKRPEYTEFELKSLEECSNYINALARVGNKEISKPESLKDYSPEQIEGSAREYAEYMVKTEQWGKHFFNRGKFRDQEQLVFYAKDRDKNNEDKLYKYIARGGMKPVGNYYFEIKSVVPSKKFSEKVNVFVDLKNPAPVSKQKSEEKIKLVKRERQDQVAA